MSSDDDAIEILIVPTLDERATERETGKLRDKFKDAGKHISDALSSDIGKELAEQLGSALGSQLTGVAADLGSRLGTVIGSKLGEGIKKVGDAIGVDLGGTVQTIGDAVEKVHGLSDAFKDFKDGKISKGVDDLSRALGGLPGPLGDVGSKSKTVLDHFSELRGSVKDVTTLFGDFEKDAPGIAGALATISDAAGPLAVIFLGIEEGIRGLTGLHNWLDTTAIERAGGLPPGMSREEFLKHFYGNDYFPGVGLPAAPGDAGAGPLLGAPGAPQLPSSPTPPPRGGIPTLLPPSPSGVPGVTAGPGAPAQPGDLGGLLGAPGAHTSGSISGALGPHVTLADYSTPSIPGTISSPEDLPGAAANIRNLFTVAESLVGTPYSQQLRNDCSGLVSELASAALGLPPPTPGERFTTVNEGQWLGSHGFQPGLGGPGDLSIGWYDHGGGNAGHTAATLPGGVHAESGGSHGAFALGAGAAGADNPQFDHHMHLPMSGGGGVRATPAGFGPPGIPGAIGSPADLPGLAGGMPGLGVYAPPPTQANTGGGPSQQEGLGHGSGIGVSGGAIGMAEQAGVMAASMFGFGGGGIAAQVAEQEMNLAIQKGGQMAATAAMAPLETLWLGGGQMGAPSVGSPAHAGWPGKLLSGLIGQQANIPNVAASVQKPKQPEPQDEQQQQPPGGGDSGPKGTKDDPMHVNVTNQPPPQQGQATSAMSTVSPAMAVMTA